MTVTRGFSWPEAPIRRAAQAVAERLRLPGPHDSIVIARLALEAAIRNSADLAPLSRQDGENRHSKSA